MVKFIYNNIKNANIGYKSFGINSGYHPHIFFEDKVCFHLRSFSVNKLAKKLIELRLIY